ncbi:hypothetical protein D3C79_554060 [compost metagenome]
MPHPELGWLAGRRFDLVGCSPSRSGELPCCRTLHLAAGGRGIPAFEVKLAVMALAAGVTREAPQDELVQRP